ncbi:MAG: hypothetical protein KDC87_11295 [Planctomycetes bacterium]|nr:hypothetical protein [Planctomycetota bacterium]MCB9868480.1 hypothetical protein [Planctomycetota bacterium]
MRDAILGALAAVFLTGGAFLLGRAQARPDGGDPSWLDSLRAPELQAQGRGPVVPPKPRTEPTKAPEPLVFGGDGGGGSASANGFMAVTGSYGIGTSVLYLFDTTRKQLLVYEARGGSQSMRRLVLVGARRIDRDLELLDYNDESEFKRADLERMLRGESRPKSSDLTVPGGLRPTLGTGKYETKRSTGR